MASNIMCMTSCTTLSRMLGIPSFLLLPFGLGIYTVRTGLNWNCGVAHLTGDLLNLLQREPIERFPVAACCHVPRLRFEALVGQEVPILLVHQAVEVWVLPVPIAVPFPQVFQSFQGLLIHPNQPFLRGTGSL